MQPVDLKLKRTFWKENGEKAATGISRTTTFIHAMKSSTLCIYIGQKYK
jgi:hypothetical protein